ncbi:MAG: ATP-binding cassette domain-containing protein [Parvicellaceae bacterium]
MSERILKALMQLFAIIAKVEINEQTNEISSDEDSRKVVSLFLKQELNQERVKEYLDLFDSFIDTHHGKSKRKDGKRKRTSVNSVKILRICTQINEELKQRQKVIVLIRIIEFIDSDKEISDQEHEFAATVSETFNISQEEFNSCLNYVTANEDSKLSTPNFLVVNNEKENKDTAAKHIYSETIIGSLRVIQVPSVNTYFVRYYGKQEMYLNGQLLPPNRIQILTQGSSLRSSRIHPIYYSDIISQFLSSNTASKIIFNAQNIQFRFNNKQLGLRDFSLSEESGKLIGIMGGSGAGKSTLLNVLNGNYPPSEGTVTINGKDIYAQSEELEGVIGFIPQDDLLIEELTVYQNLFYNSKLCFGNYSDEQINELVDTVLKSIGLYETRDLKVGSPLEKTISGGQRKRLNIALELIREPSVMFVDEPTSGLSSRDSENIMDLLKILALKGKLIFVVIHQPSSDIFKMFDKLIILDVGGYPIYNGNPIDAVIYFKKLVNHVNADQSECGTCGNVNPEQIFNIIDMKVVDEYGNITPNRKISPKEWNRHYENLHEVSVIEEDQEEIPESIFKIPNKIKQAKTFFIRDFKSKLTNTQYMIITLFEAPLLAGILAFFMKYIGTNLFNENNYSLYNSENLPQYLFISVIVALFIGLTTSAEEIIGNLKILKREQFLNLSKGSYLFSKISLLFLISLIQTLFYVLAGNIILEIHGMNLAYWMILFSVSCFANLLGLNISASFNSVKVIYILIPVCIIPQLLFSGIIVSFDKLNPLFSSKSHVPAIGNIMASRWAFEALAVTQFKDNDYEAVFYQYDKAMSFANWKKDQWVSNIQSKLKDIKRHIETPNSNALKKQMITQQLQIVKHEIQKELRHNKSNNYTQNGKLNKLLNQLTLSSFSTETYQTIADYLSYCKDGYKKTYKINESLRDNAQQKFIKPNAEFMNLLDKEKAAKRITSKEHRNFKRLMSKLKDENFKRFRNRYKNKALEDFVTNSNTLNFTDEDHQSVIQKTDPIYLDPYDFDYFKSHFYSPRKKVFGHYLDTYYANLIVIWAMTLFLVITLYFDTLKWLINAPSKLQGKLKRK